MKLKKRHCIRVCMPGCLVLISQMVVLPAASAATDIPVELSVSVVQRKDNLNWNIAGYNIVGNPVNVLSELKWENILISQLQAAADLHLINDRRFRAKLGFGVIKSGTNQDSDYNGNNRTQEFSRSNNKAGGDVFDASVGIGKKLLLRELSAGKSFYVTPFVGLSIHQQYLTMTDGVQTLCVSPYCTSTLGPFPSLASSYDTQWMGPWLGAEARIKTEKGWDLMANAEYHLVDYTAKGNWNLRADLAHPVSFSHTATGDGIVLSIGASYSAGKNWKVNFMLEHQQWSTRVGSDLVNLANGSVGYQPLNPVNWDSTTYSFGIIRQF